MLDCDPVLWNGIHVLCGVDVPILLMWQCSLQDVREWEFILPLFVLEQGGSRSLDGDIIIANPAYLQYDELKY